MLGVDLEINRIRDLCDLKLYNSICLYNLYFFGGSTIYIIWFSIYRQAVEMTGKAFILYKYCTSVYRIAIAEYKLVKGTISYP